MAAAVSVPANKISVIEWHMLNHNRFFCLTLLNSLTLRTALYPLTVIKTRLQIQKHRSLYVGTCDAFAKILRFEGVAGLYKGFVVNSLQVVSSVGYIFTYEKVRNLLHIHTSIRDGRIKALIAGGCASIVGQTIVNPFDVVSQHMMLIGQTVSATPSSESKVKGFALARLIAQRVYASDGPKGFYRGYFASLNISIPSSGLWWMFYSAYSDLLATLSPAWVPHLLINSVAGPMGGMTVSVLTNPLDIIRARIQVQRLNSISEALVLLWGEERWNVFVKGLSARLVQNVVSSFFIVLGYETLKRWSLLEQYKSQIKW